MTKRIRVETLRKRILENTEEPGPLLVILRSGRGPAETNDLARELSKVIAGDLIRSARTPNSDISLYEIRRKDRAVILLIVKADEEKIVAIDKISDEEISEIESNIYSSNINDVYVRLVSDIF